VKGLYPVAVGEVRCE